jgi:hypothetical protein
VRARGIDPGDTIGWCDLEREAPGVFRYVAHGTIEPREIVRVQRMPIDDYGIDVHAIETPEEMHPNQVREQAAYPATMVQTVRNLISTAVIAERIACSLVLAGARIVQPTAAECRRALGVKFGAQRGKGPKLTVDQQVKAKLQLYVRGWPARSNVHVRDGGVAAFFALACPEDLAVLGIAA